MLMVGGSFPGTLASSTTKTGCHDIAKILLKVSLKHNKSNQINNISVISWQSVLLVEETRVTGENHDLSQVTDRR